MRMQRVSATQTAIQSHMCGTENRSGARRWLASAGGGPATCVVDGGLALWQEWAGLHEGEHRGCLLERQLSGGDLW